MAQAPDEKTYVEIPFIEQLKGMGWDHIEGDIDVPYLTERESFRDVLLTGRLRDTIKKINLDDGGEPWLDDDRVNEVVSRLEESLRRNCLKPIRRHLISSCRVLR